MKYIVSLILLVTLFSFSPVGDIYNIAVKTIDGNRVYLNQYKEKKMLFIVLPTLNQDTAVAISHIVQLQNKYQGSLVVIGIPSEEAGYKLQDIDKFKKMYKDANANFIITEGMKVKKGSGQSPLFQWLTSKDQNRHFDQDVQGVGSKLFVDEAGELYAVIGPKLKVTDPLVDRIIARKQPKN